MANAEIMNSGLEKEVCPKWLLFANAAVLGFFFGYDIGITGCVTSNSNFLRDYFPHVYKNLMSQPSDSTYNYFSDDGLNFYRSSLYIAGFVSSTALAVAPGLLRDKAMSASCCFLFLGSLFGVGGAFHNIASLIASRILFGIGIGIIIMLMTTHLSEVGRSRYRSRLLVLFQLAITVGILTANLIYFLPRNPNVKHNWRIGYLAYTPLPLVLMIATLFLVALVEKELDLGMVLVRIPLSGAIFERKYRPQLSMVICIPLLQQLTGVYAFVTYAPVFFNTMGLGERGSGICSIAMCVVNYAVALKSYVSFDEYRRRKLFMQGGALMLICQATIASVIGAREDSSVIPKWNAVLLVVAWCGYMAGFAWSWGPLGWLVPSEVLPSEVRLAGNAISVSVNLISMFFVTHYFTIGLCKMKFFMHLIVSCMVFFFTVFVYVFLPETKGVNVSEEWKKHWYWKKYVEDDSRQRNILV